MFEWDDNKRRDNQAKHGVDFAEVVRFEWGTALIAEDTHHPEQRFTALGYIGNRLHMLVYAERGTKTRVISLRIARPKEVRRYAET